MSATPRLLGLLVALALASAAAATAARPFTFKEFFVGEWTVHRSTVSLKDQTVTTDDSVRTFHVLRDNETESGLVGTVLSNDTTTGEVSEDGGFWVALGETDDAGVYKMGESEEEAAPLFEFSFEEQPNGVFLSHGAWQAGAKRSYQFAAHPWNAWTVTIFDGGDSVQVWSASRVLYPVEKTFFQKWGTMLMIGAFFIFNTFVQKKTRAQMEAQAGAGGAGLAAGGAGSDEPIVESASSKKDD